MCAYNGMPYIRDAVSSIMAQTFTDWELIISDDGSNDGTREWLRDTLGTHPRVRLFFQDRNLGYVANKNFAHRQAQGEYLTQLDNDDTSAPDRLERQLSAMEQQGVKIVGCGYTRINEAGDTIGVMTESAGRRIDAPSPGAYPFWFPSLLIHRSVFEAVGYFSTYFAGALGDDLYWTVRANERFPIWYCNEPLYHYRYSATSITNVLDNDRKLLMEPVLDELFRQRRTGGGDWLEAGKPELAAGFEDELRHNRRFMSGQYRTWAAKAIDRQNFGKARQLLLRAIGCWPFSLSLFKTTLYYFRKRLGA
jgi:glycosyltransferase involved in cell wall biosynthesis